MSCLWESFAILFCTENFRRWVWSASTPRATRPPQVPLARTPSGTSPMPHRVIEGLRRIQDQWRLTMSSLCPRLRQTVWPRGSGARILGKSCRPNLPSWHQIPWAWAPKLCEMILLARRLAQLRKRCFHVALKLLDCLTLLYMVYGTYLRAYSNPIDEVYKPTNMTFGVPTLYYSSFRSARVQPLLYRWQKGLTWKPPKNAEKLETWKEKRQIIQLPFWRYCSIFLWLIP